MRASVKRLDLPSPRGGNECSNHAVQRHLLARIAHHPRRANRSISASAQHRARAVCATSAGLLVREMVSGDIFERQW